jgi:cytochrome c biogenesis protein CcdA
MNHFRLVFLSIAVSAAALLADALPSGKLTVHFFGSSTCEECHQIQTLLLQPLSERYDGRLDLKIHDLETDSGLQLAMTMEKRYGVKKTSPQELFLPDTFVTGYKDIMQSGRQLIEQRLERVRALQQTWAADTAGAPVNLRSAIKERMSMFTFVALFGAGFLDGVNPCAIATMIFLISFLGTQKRRRIDVIKIGLAFSATVYVTYFSIGLGAFRILTLMDQFFWLSLGINAVAVCLSVYVAILSIRDAVVFYRTHDTAAMKVQLPRPIKLLIHSVIKDNLSSNKIVVGAVITGFIVTLLEGVCTAKIYLPTIVVMTKAVGFRLLGWLLLVFYNFLFVLPLLIVMMAAAFGMKWTRLSKFTQNHLALMKVLLALVLFALAGYITVHTMPPTFWHRVQGLMHAK